MSNLIIIGQTAQQKDIFQDRMGDFRWSMDFFDVNEAGVESAQDLAGCSFDFIIYAQDGTTQLAALSNTSGIVVVDNNVQINLALSTYQAWKIGCKYPYFFRKTDASGLKIPIYKGYFILS